MGAIDDPVVAGETSFQAWSDGITATPEGRAVYAEESAKMDLWLQLVEARQAVGLTQADLAERLGVSQSQVARIEKRGYDAHSLNTLRRYVAALGDGFGLEVRVRHPETKTAALTASATQHERQERTSSDGSRGA